MFILNAMYILTHDTVISLPIQNYFEALLCLTRLGLIRFIIVIFCYLQQQVISGIIILATPGKIVSGDRYLAGIDGKRDNS